jgi:hypothetical protein
VPGLELIPDFVTDAQEQVSDAARCAMRCDGAVLPLHIAELT